MDLSDPQTLRRVFEQHERGVYAAALRILGNTAQAQDVVQDVFLRIWRRPGARHRQEPHQARPARLRQECPALAHEAALNRVR